MGSRKLVVRWWAGALACLVFLGGCGGGAAGPRRLTLANVHIAGYPTAAGLERFASLVAEDPELASAIDIDLQLGGVLGNEKEVLEKLGFGGIQMACTSVAPLAEFVPAVGVLTLPYLFRDSEHMWKVLRGEIGRELWDALEAQGFIGLAWYDAGARSFYNRHRPVRRLADLEGLKIRVQKSEVMRQTVAALGASPVSIGFKQVYTNLHTGAIDGAENNLPSFLSERHFEVAHHYAFDRHSMVPDLLMIRRQAWDALSPARQSALRRAAEASSEAQRGLWAAYVEEARRELEAAGCEFSEIEDPEAFRAAVAPVYAQHGEAYGGLIERIRAVE